MNVFEESESSVRHYSRAFPAVFDRASGSYMYSESGRKYLDFFCGAGALNYGHNEKNLQRVLLNYIEKDGVAHGLDMATTAKRLFISMFNKNILEPRGMEYKYQFTGPTGTNAVEAAIKLARKVTGRQNIVSFTSSFHGMSAGSLAISGNPAKRRSLGVPADYSVIMPYDQCEHVVDSLGYVRGYLRIAEMYSELPAAIILETIQADGGVNVARSEWVTELSGIAKEFGALLIVDDIQVGCGRTGSFFSFEKMGITPDVICLSKSLSGFGLPLSLVLIRPEWDKWEEGEHAGTFRGNNLAFVTGARASEFWEDGKLEARIEKQQQVIGGLLREICSGYHDAGLRCRGRGMIWGLQEGIPGLARQIAREAFSRGLMVETAGDGNSVIKIMPSLFISEEDLRMGCTILDDSICASLHKGNGFIATGT